MSTFDEIAAKAGKRSGKGLPHVRIRRGFSRARFIASMGGPIEWATYCVLLDHQNGQTGESYPSVDTIALAVGVSDRRIQQGLRHLETIGAIAAITSRKGGRAKSISYRVNPWETVNLIRPFEPEKGAERVNKTTVKGERGSPERIEERGGRIGLTPTAASKGT
jgi:hypothetical protein